MTESERETTRRLKLQQWQQMWQSRWKTEGPPHYELAPAGDIAGADWEREFLAASRTPDRERQRLDRITREFSDQIEIRPRPRHCR